MLALIIAAAKGAGWLSSRAGQPAVFGELLVGVLLGPTVLDVMSNASLGGPHLQDTIFLLGSLGAVMLLFLAGLETDLSDLRRVGGAATTVATLGVLVPILGGAALAPLFKLDLSSAIFLGIVLAATSVSISARTLVELGVLRSLAGLTILAAAVVDDVEALVVLSLFAALATGAGGAAGVALVIVKVIVYFALAVVVGRFAFARLTSWVARANISEGLAAAAITLALVYAWGAEEFAGIAAITGAYVAGVLLTRTELRRTIEEKMHTLTYSILVPIFFVSIGLAVNARALNGSYLGFLIVVLVLAVVTKVAGCGIGGLIYRFKPREALQVGVGMISRGEVGLIVAAFGLGNGLINQELFSVTVIMVLFTTIVTPLLLRASFVEAGEKVNV
ncbi:MAG: cation:proton antiporter [Chloroflexi bacterium]|nr:cation:proton antiporter [Chloroflexota bacterium]